MSPSSAAAALAAGATVITPNNRLAREIVARADAARRAEGSRAWPAADVLPLSLWLARLWHAALAAGVAPRALLDRETSRELWYAMVTDAARSSLLNPRGAARRAADAWSTFHGWRQGGERLDTVTRMGSSEDAAVFLTWAARYRARLRELDAIDTAQLPDALRQAAHAAWAGGGAPVVLHGFLGFTAQERRLVDALREAGMSITESPAVPVASARRSRVAYATAREEITAALSFARARVAADPNARIAIVVADLDQRRDEVVALAEEILCPERLLALETDAPRPYGVSLGEPLSAAPIVACALDLISLACGGIDTTAAAALVRSPFLPDASSRWTGRAAAEHDWLRHGERHVDVGMLAAGLRAHDAVLSHRLASLAALSKTRRSPRDWARAFSDWLGAAGWPGNATLASGQWQAREAWSSALAQFASLGSVTGPLSQAAALDALRALVSSKLFQPEAAAPPIAILGTLEAAGLSFDSAWLAGFDSACWPAPVGPNPFLPLAWQVARGVPRADPATALAQSRALTDALGAIAPEIIVSHVQTIDDTPAVISPLFASWESKEPYRQPVGRYADAIRPATLERWTERAGPTTAADVRLAGGAALFESQSACPFQAFARYRLGAREFTKCPEGLSAAERGIVLHEALKAFWDDVGDHASLAALDADALAARVAQAATKGLARLDARRQRALAPVVASGEAGRLATTLHAWLVDRELPRPPFRVRVHEARIAYDAGGFGVDVRIDRIDELATGGLAIIDYKSGRVVQPSRWTADRPEGIQLAVYASALAPTTDDPIRALAYAQVRAGEVAVTGIAEGADVWPALDVPGTAADWQAAREALQRKVESLASEIRTGLAIVNPRDRGLTCRYCGLQALCRIPVLEEAGNDAAPGPADE
jgi:probable DNA repair protein